MKRWYEYSNGNQCKKTQDLENGTESGLPQHDLRKQQMLDFIWTLPAARNTEQVNITKKSCPQ